jgi:hypothetical protein
MRRIKKISDAELQQIPPEKLTTEQANSRWGALSDFPNRLPTSQTTSQIQGRRGQVFDMQTEGDQFVVTGKAPVAELFGFAGDLRSATEGRAMWSTEFAGFEEVPVNIMKDVVMAIRTRKDLLPFYTRVIPKHIFATSRLVSKITGMVVQPNKAVVGSNAFAHEVIGDNYFDLQRQCVCSAESLIPREYSILNVYYDSELLANRDEVHICNWRSILEENLIRRVRSELPHCILPGRRARRRVIFLSPRHSGSGS